MSDLISNLQRLGDAEHDDLSVAHDALAEIVRLRILTVEQHDEIERLTKSEPTEAQIEAAERWLNLYMPTKDNRRMQIEIASGVLRAALAAKDEK